MVDWPGCSRAGRKLSDSKRMTVFKLEFDLLAILQHRSRFDWKVNNRCPWCNHLNEDINHVIQCTDTAKSRKSLWDTDAKYMQNVYGRHDLVVCWAFRPMGGLNTMQNGYHRVSSSISGISEPIQHWVGSGFPWPHQSSLGESKL